MILAAKPGCDGEDCVLVGGLVPECIESVNQKLWQFMNQFGEPPIHGDIEDTYSSSDVFARAFAKAVGHACSTMDAEAP